MFRRKTLLWGSAATKLGGIIIFLDGAHKHCYIEHTGVGNNERLHIGKYVGVGNVTRPAVVLLVYFVSTIELLPGITLTFQLSSQALLV